LEAELKVSEALAAR
jgi:hypothetical protein